MEMQCRIQTQRRLQMNMMQAQHIRSVEYQHAMMMQVQQNYIMEGYMRLASSAVGGCIFDRGTNVLSPWMPHTSMEGQSVPEYILYGSTENPRLDPQPSSNDEFGSSTDHADASSKFLRHSHTHKSREDRGGGVEGGGFTLGEDVEIGEMED